MTEERRPATPQNLTKYLSLLSTKEGKSLSDEVRQEMLAELLSKKARTLLKMHGGGGITPAVDIALTTAQVSLTLARAEGDNVTLNLAAETRGVSYESQSLFRFEGNRVLLCIGSEPMVGSMLEDVDPLLIYMATRLSQPRAQVRLTNGVSGFLGAMVHWRRHPDLLRNPNQS